MTTVMLFYDIKTRMLRREQLKWNVSSRHVECENSSKVVIFDTSHDEYVRTELGTLIIEMFYMIIE
jgi:hypothetical protein